MEKIKNLENLRENLEKIKKKSPDESPFLIIIRKEQENQEEIELFSEILNIYYQDFRNLEKSLEIALKCYDLMKNLEISSISKNLLLKKCEFLDILGTLYQEKCDFLQSLKYFQEALTVKSSVYDENNEEIAVTLRNIAEIQSVFNNKQEAMKNYSRCIEIHRKNFGDIDQMSLVIYYNLGLLSKSLEKLEKAKDFLENALKIVEIIKSPDDRDAIILELSEIYCELEYSIETEDFLLKLEEIERNIKENPEKLLKVMKTISKIYRKTSRFDKSLEFSEKLVNLAEKMQNSEALLSGLNNLAEIYFKIGDLKKNLETQMKTIPILKMTNEKDPLLAITYRNIAEVNRSIQNNEKALDFYGKSLEFYEFSQEFKEEKAMICEKIAGILEENGDFDKMREFLEKSLKFLDFSIEIEKNAIVFNRLGLIYYENEDFLKAKDCFEKSLEINAKFNNEDSIIYHENLEKCRRKIEENKS